ncbi:MAG: hypothetical protein FWF54_05300 [Candidatus Azobacteroides sp.]|nr:hypothetical protein [Candidatus Azobacteroides sp.]
MKISVEEIRTLNITAYIDFLENKLNNIHIAIVTYPFYVERQTQLSLSRWRWYTYFIQKEDYKNYWFEKYNEIAQKRIEDLSEKIETATNDLIDIVHFTNTIHSNILTKNPNETMTKKCLKMAKTIDFRDLQAQGEAHRYLFNTSVEYDKDEIKKKLQFNDYAIADKIKEFEERDFDFVGFIKKGTFCSAYFLDSRVCLEFASLEFYKWLAMYDSQKQPLHKPTKTLNKTQFTELLKALIETKSLEYETEKQAIEALAFALNVDINKSEFDRILQKIKGRNEVTETKFLDALTTDLKDWIKKSSG